MALLDHREQVQPGAPLGVVRGPLVRVLAVGELELLPEPGHERLREHLRLGEPVRDRRLVRGGQREGLGGQAPSRLERELAAGAQLDQDLLVALGLGHRRDVGEVLRGRAQHRRPADVDHLDGVLLADRAAGDDVLERVEVHADEVEGLDVVVLELVAVVGAVSPGEDRRVNPRMQRLHAPAQQLGCLGYVLDRRDRDPDLLQERGRAAARHDLDVELREAACERLEALLVVDRDQRALDHEISSRTTSGRSRCSTAWTRARRLETSSPASTGTRSTAITGPLSTPSST